MPSFGKRTPLTRRHFQGFEQAFGEDPLGKSLRKDEGEQGRFRMFTCEHIKAQGNNLDISWLRDERQGREDAPLEPETIAEEIREQLTTALLQIDALSQLLSAGETK